MAHFELVQLENVVCAIFSFLLQSLACFCSHRPISSHWMVKLCGKLLFASTHLPLVKKNKMRQRIELAFELQDDVETFDSQRKYQRQFDIALCCLSARVCWSQREQKYPLTFCCACECRVNRKSISFWIVQNEENE